MGEDRACGPLRAELGGVTLLADERRRGLRVRPLLDHVGHFVSEQPAPGVGVELRHAGREVNLAASGEGVGPEARCQPSRGDVVVDPHTSELCAESVLQLRAEVCVNWPT